VVVGCVGPGEQGRSDIKGAGGISCVYGDPEAERELAFARPVSAQQRLLYRSCPPMRVFVVNLGFDSAGMAFSSDSSRMKQKWRVCLSAFRLLA
jgi:hypothetical protein